jgi:phospholipid/cholesterol/gamma-HCH transport system substrate-binding protein
MKRSNRLGVRAAALAVSASLLVGGCDFNVYELPLPGGADVGDNSYTVTVYFDDVLDLVPQSAVKVDDVTVGKVEDISLQGYTAEVLLRLNGKVNLPDNAVANIRQTSLLGEKFVALSPPPDGSGTGRLGPGEEIPLERSGRNPEVEEVLGALSLLLNGGGVAQLKTITVELNKVLEGNEEGIKSLLAQLDTFMGQIDDNKQDIVRAIEAVNRLAKTAKEQTSSINAALDRMPRALDSLDKQRDDLIRMLDALGRLSDVGTRVIRASKANTVNSLESLAPILSQLADAGRSLPKALQVFLTYPFVDAVVGTTPAEARNLHQGDFTNLSAKLDIDLEQMLATPPGLPAPPELPNLPGLPNLPTPPGGPSVPDPGGDLPGNPLGDSPQPRGGGGDDPDSGLLPSQPPNPDGAGGTEPGAGSGNASQDSGCLLVLCRTRPAYSGNTETDPSDTARLGYDPDVAALMLQGVTRR